MTHPGGYRMPAEWETHEATWIAWPHERSDWPGKFAPIPWVYGELVRHLSRGEIVRILVKDAHTADGARRVLGKSGAHMDSVEFIHLPTDRGWTRDFCPIFVHNKSGVALTHWRFNGWAKYPNHKRDAQIPVLLRRRLKLPYSKAMHGKRHIVLEGGSIDVNGLGTLLTTEECLLSQEVQARNPGMTREEIEQAFARYLGIRRVIWLKNGIAGDDTHGHVDDIARFVNPNTVVIATESDQSEENHAILEENVKLMKAARDQDGRPLKIVKLPMPQPVWFDGQRLPASYANFYIANYIVLAPVFNDPADRDALNILTRVFPDHEVIPIYCGDLVLGLGTIHCATQQQPG